MKKILLSLVLVIFVGFLSGCGQSSDISNKLNEIVKSNVDTWDSNGYAHTFTVSDIQSSLDSKNSNLVIIASGSNEFTNSVTNIRYVENLGNYRGDLYSNTRMLEKDMNVNYFLVLNKDNNKYYSVKVTYKTKKLNDVEKEYPYFDSDKEL